MSNQDNAEKEKPSAGAIAGYLVLMTILALLGFAALAAVVQYRMGEPLAAAAGETAAPASAGAGESVSSGLRQSIETARGALEKDERPAGMHALDAARRLAELGGDAATGEAGSGFKRALDQIKQARRAIQNGFPERAPEYLQSALSALQQSRGVAPALPPPPADLAAYDGATVLNAHGIRLGKIKTVEAGGAEAHFELGPMKLLGFIPAGGPHISVPASKVIFGKPKGIGPTMVGLPTFETKLDRVGGSL